jgi:hypothetical protein
MNRGERECARARSGTVYWRIEGAVPIRVEDFRQGLEWGCECPMIWSACLLSVSQSSPDQDSMDNLSAYFFYLRVGIRPVPSARGVSGAVGAS